MILILCIVKIIYDRQQSIKAVEYIQDRYRYTKNYVNEHMESIKEMCDYDLEHCDEYQLRWKNVYYVPKMSTTFSSERNAIFHDLGFYDGFGDGYIYLDDSHIEFRDYAGRDDMILVYYKYGNDNANESYEKIGGYFTIFQCKEPARNILDELFD